MCIFTQFTAIHHHMWTYLIQMAFHHPMQPTQGQNFIKERLMATKCSLTRPVSRTGPCLLLQSNYIGVLWLTMVYMSRILWYSQLQAPPHAPQEHLISSKSINFKLFQKSQLFLGAQWTSMIALLLIKGLHLTIVDHALLRLLKQRMMVVLVHSIVAHLWKTIKA